MMKIETSVKHITHDQLEGQEPIGFFNLIFSHGFIYMMSLMWVPTLIIFIIGFRLIKKMK